MGHVSLFEKSRVPNGGLGPPDHCINPTLGLSNYRRWNVQLILGSAPLSQAKLLCTRIHPFYSNILLSSTLSIGFSVCHNNMVPLNIFHPGKARNGGLGTLKHSKGHNSLHTLNNFANMFPELLKHNIVFRPYLPQNVP